MHLLPRLRAIPPDTRRAFLASLSKNTRIALPTLWRSLWARPEQLPPPGDWSTWLVMGGRGSGKTRAGAEWVRAQVEGATPRDPGLCRRVAIIGETADQARDIMVLGESGLLAISPPDRRPTFHVSRRHLIWPNGAEAHLFSASDPESLRGPQFDAAWCDELAKWKRTQEAWDMLQFGLRLGDNPRTVVTTTPRANRALIALMNDPATALTRMPTRDNRANLAPTFLKQIEARYAGRPLGRQELNGDLLEDTPGAFWTRAMIEDAQITAAPPLSPHHRSRRSARHCTQRIRRVRHRRCGHDASAKTPPQPCWPTGRCKASRRKHGPPAPSPPIVFTMRIGWWPRSTKAAIWSRPSSARSTPTSRSRPFVRHAAKLSAPNLCKPCMNRAGCNTSPAKPARSQNSKIRCARFRQRPFAAIPNPPTASTRWSGRSLTCC